MDCKNCKYPDEYCASGDCPTSQSPRNDLATEPQAVEKPKKERMTCKRYCPVWNDIDHDCEIFGEHHFTPRTCPHYQKEIQNDNSTSIHR